MNYALYYYFYYYYFRFTGSIGHVVSLWSIWLKTNTNGYSRSKSITTQ